MLAVLSHVRRTIQRHFLPVWMAAACLMLVGSDCAQTPVVDPLLAEAQAKIRASQYYGVMPLLQQSANHGHAVAMRELGLVYARGLGRRIPDPKWGLQWFQRASAAGDEAAAFNIAELYATGNLGNPDYALARFWYAKSYAAKDARGAIGQAELACSGTGEKRDLSRCSQLLGEAGKLKASNGSDPALRLSTDWHTLGDAYRTAGARAPAAGAYRHAAAFGDVSAAIAEYNLYLRTGSNPQDLAKATAALDSYVDAYKQSHPHGYDMPGYDEVAALYVEIGDAYQRLGAAQTARAVTVYAAAAELGISGPAVRLAIRYAQGTGVPRNLPAAAKQLLALEDPSPQSQAAKVYLAALQSTAKAFDRSTNSAANSAIAKSLSARADEVIYAPPLPPPPPPPPLPPEPLPVLIAAVPVQDRFPNMIAPPSVQPLQKFPVMVSLNASQFDKNTVVVSGGQSDGQVQITLPAGITAVQIGVNLIAPAMTSVDGLYTQNIELTKDQDSTTAIFQLQAGAAASTSPILATLTYNGAFLAEIRRDVLVADVATSAAPAPVVLLSQPPVKPLAPAVRLDPEKRAPDMTIQEVQLGDSLLYTVYAPGFGFTGPTVVTGAAQRQAMMAKLYTDLEAQGNVLDQIGGKSASQQARDFAEGKGNDLYDQLAPDAFKTMYQKMKTAGAPPTTIQVLTSSPSLPWELLRPLLTDGTRENFLGTTVAIVTGDAASAPRVPPPLTQGLQAMKVVAPHYDGDLSLAGAQQEVIALKTSFPGLVAIDGSVDGVSALGRALPDGIIHYAGHGVRVTVAGLPPDVALSLSDGSIVPSTWKNLAEQSPQAHPFYFFNACDLGRSDATLDYISGWASTLMQSGASGYLGALWKVSDTTATSFANHFYRDLKVRLAGNAPWSVAEVVTQARSETYQEAFDPTALAYVLYADPYQTMTDQE